MGNHSGHKIPEVRDELLTTLKEEIGRLGVLDEFKSAGVFVNWWQQIRYDLKTVVSIGWHHTLIPDEYLIGEFFQSEADAIEELKSRISGLQTELAEVVDMAQEVAAYEPDEDETVTSSTVKKALSVLIDDLKDSVGASVKLEIGRLKAQQTAILEIEKKVKGRKASLKYKTKELGEKLQLKRIGAEGIKSENQQLIQQIQIQLSLLDPNNKSDKRKVNALNKDKTVLESHIVNADALLETIGGQLTDGETKFLVLKKLYDILNAELKRYLTVEIRRLISGIENLRRKYAVSGRELEKAQEATIHKLYRYMNGLGYTQ